MTDVGSTSLLIRLLIGLFLSALMLALDVFVDGLKMYGVPHVVLEIGAISILIGLMSYVIFLYWTATLHVSKLGNVANQRQLEIKQLREQIETWQGENQDLVQAFRARMLEQFASWNLTDAEQQIATRLLQGESLKRIAFERSTSEATVRQQASEVYRKSGLAGRNELAAWFLTRLA